MSDIDNTLDISIPVVSKSESGGFLPTTAFEEHLFNISLVSAAVSNVVASTVSVTSADATDLPTVITLANEMKADLNTLVTNLNTSITQLNLLLANLRTARKLET